jgi:hypothetical protein
MNKRRIAPAVPDANAEADWLALEAIAEVELTSERADHPIEAALAAHPGGGWRADAPGPQTIRLIFEPPRPVRRVRVVVEERDRARTQEMVLRARAAVDGSWREIVRQQFNFSPEGATRELEDFHVGLPSVAGLELTIVPDISGGDARATLQQLRLAG